MGVGVCQMLLLDIHINGYDFVRCFYWIAIYMDMILWFFFANLMWWITLIDFRMLNQLCILGIYPIWLCCAILFICWWTWFANIFRIFTSMFLRSICHYKKIEMSLSCFHIRYLCWLHGMSQEVFSLLLVSEND